MALLDNPPAASSSEEYESGSGESEPVEPSQPQSMKPEPIATKPLPQASSSGETETDSESESEEEAVAESPVPLNSIASKANSKPADAPMASSSGDTETGSESESEEEAVAESPAPLNSIASKANSKPADAPMASSSGDTETGSESESEEEAVAESPAPLNSIASKANSKPADAPMSPAKPQSPAATPVSANSEPAAVSPAKSGTKRAAAAESDSKEAKKAKMPEVDESNKASGKLFQRIWSDDDEVVILKGMCDYAKKGMNPYADMAAFLAFTKNSLSFEVSKSQLQDKIRRLKKKFENNLGKKQKPRKPHELNTFHLSMKVWGGGENDPAGKSEQPMINGKAKSKTPKEGTSKTTPKASGSGLGEVFGFDKGFREMGFSENIMKQGLDLLYDSERAELKEKWNQIHVAEMQLYSKKLELMLWETKLILGSEV